LAILAGQEAKTSYGLSILHKIEQITGRSISIGAVYKALGRLEARGQVSSEVGEPTPERGGRGKRLYSIEPKGQEALMEARRITEAIWNGLDMKHSSRRIAPKLNLKESERGPAAAPAKLDSKTPRQTH
jgi:DNA-binding PadR family transcriptional regulator